MNATGWRTVIVDRPEQLTLRDGSIILRKDDTEHAVPVEQVRQLMISGGSGAISMPLLHRLMAQHTSVILCDGHHQPTGELMGTAQHSQAAGRLMDQAAWTARRKQAVWRRLVRMKIDCQLQLLTMLRREVPSRMALLADEVNGDDDTNRESVAARMYFTALFGKAFRRRASDHTNAALNYGYAVLMSAVSRCIAMHGFSTALGIHHCSRANRFNLSCDLMEPFRPFVDQLVAQNPERPLDWPYMQQLIGLPQRECLWAGEHTTVAQAIDGLVLDTLQAMCEPRGQIREVRLG